MHGEPAVSERARLLLRDAGRRGRGRAAPAVELLAARGLTPFPALLDLEEWLGGAVLRSRSFEVEIGVARMAEVEGDPRAGPDGSRVLVGRQDPWTAISMSADGRLWSHGPDDAPWELAASLPAYVEQLARRAVIDAWSPDPFRVLLEPAGEALARLLGLGRDALSSDDVETAWTGDAGWLVQRHRGDPYATSFAELLGRDLEAAVDALLVLANARPGVRARVIGPGTTAEEHHRDGYARPGAVPDPRALAAVPGTVRLDYLGSCLAYLGAPDDVGDVWVLGAPGARRVEQLVRPGSDPGAGHVEWSSFAGEGAVRRLFLPVHRAG